MTRAAQARDVTMLPYWTALRTGGGTDGGIWALGLEQIGLRLADEMLPGLTNQTVHARYYSMFAWAFWKFAEIARAHGRVVAAEEQDAWFRRVENAFRVASELAEPGRRALVGSRAVRRRWDEIDRRGGRVSLVDDAPASAWVPYGASFREMRCGVDDRGLVQLLRPTGVDLAETFDAQLRATRPGRALIAALMSRAQSIDVDLLRAVADEFALRQLQTADPEHAPLLEMLAPHTERDAAVPEHVRTARRDRARSRTMGLFLDIAREGRGALQTFWDVHRVFAGGAPRARAVYQPPDVFARDFLRWQRYQERQHQKLALYGLWRDVHDLLLGRRGWWAPAHEIVDHILDAAGRSDVLAEWCGRNPLDVRVETALTRVWRKVRAWDDPSTTAPYTLSQDLIGSRTAEDGTATSRAVATALATIVEWESRRDAGTVPVNIGAIHRWGGRRRVALEVFTSDVRERSALTIRELLTWMLETCVIGQSLHVAVEKWEDQRQDRFFLAPEGNGYVLVQKQDFRNLGYDGGRVMTAFRLLEELGLVDDGNGVRITTAGRQALSAIRRHHEGLAHEGIVGESDSAA